MDEFPTTWEQVSDNNDLVTWRLRVPSGWLVTVRDGTTDSSNLHFIADPTGQWVLSTVAET